MNRLRVIHLFILLLFSNTVQSQPYERDDPFALTLDELKHINVESIDFTNRTLNDSFASAHVITSNMIEQLPMFTLSDYFELLIPGVIVHPQGTIGSGFGVRGQSLVDSKHTLVLWDGHSLNRLTANGNMSLYHSPLLNDLEQVEVVLGPGSVKHGTGALHGYVNLVPKNGSDHQGGNVDLDYGSTDESRRLQMQYGTKYGVNRDFFIYAGYFKADGFNIHNDFGGASSTSITERNKFKNRNEITMGNYDPNYKFSLNWTHDRFNLKTLYEHIQFNPGGLLTGQIAQTQRSTLSIQPRYTFQLPNKSSFELAGAYTLLDKSRTREPIDGDGMANEVGGSEKALELRGTFQTRYFNKHELALGGQIKWLDINSRKHFFSRNPNENFSHVDGDWYEYSMFIEDNFSLSDKANLIAGIRYDAAKFNSDFLFDGRNLPVQSFRPADISNLSPRLALTYKTDNDYVLRAVYQEGFTYPAMFQYPLLTSINEFLDSQGLETFPDRNPEVLKDFEIGIRGDLIKNTLSFDLTAYYNRYESRTIFVNLRTNQSVLPEGLDRALPRNIFGIELELDNDIDAYGGELSLAYKPNEQIIANVSYAYTVPDHINEEDNQLVGLTTENLSEWTDFPKHQIKADISLKHNKWLFTLAGVYQSGLKISNRFAPERENAADEYVRFNAGMNYQINDKFNVGLIIKNVFGNNTPKINSDPTRPWQGSLGSDERLIYLGLNYQF